MNDPLADLDQVLAASPNDSPSGPAQEEDFPLDAPPSYVSPTLLRIAAERRPSPSTVCEACPASMWLASRTEVQCYCRIMHNMSWTADEPIALVECDGLVEQTQQWLAQIMAGAPLPEPTEPERSDPVKEDGHRHPESSEAKD